MGRDPAENVGSFAGRPPAIVRHGGQRRLVRHRLHLGRGRFQSLWQEYGPRWHRMKPWVFRGTGKWLGRGGCRLCFFLYNRPAATSLRRTAARETECQEATGQEGGRSPERSGAHAIRLEKAIPMDRDMIPRSKRIGAASAGTLGIIGKVCLIYRLPAAVVPDIPVVFRLQKRFLAALIVLGAGQWLTSDAAVRQRARHRSVF